HRPRVAARAEALVVAQVQHAVARQPGGYANAVQAARARRLQAGQRRPGVGTDEARLRFQPVRGQGLLPLRVAVHVQALPIAAGTQAGDRLGAAGRPAVAPQAEAVGAVLEKAVAAQARVFHAQVWHHLAAAGAQPVAGFDVGGEIVAAVAAGHAGQPVRAGEQLALDV